MIALSDGGRLIRQFGLAGIEIELFVVDVHIGGAAVGSAVNRTCISVSLKLPSGGFGQRCPLIVVRK